MTSRDVTPEDLAAARRHIEKEMWQKVLDTYEGRFIIYSILSMGDIYGNSTKPFDTERLNRMVGRDEVAQEVLKCALTANPGVYILMQQEAQDFADKFDLDQAGRKDDDDG